MRRILVTGGAGFIGSNFIRLVLRERSDLAVVNLDLLTYAGNLENLADLAEHPRYAFRRGDIRNAELLEELFGGGVDLVVNLAAESHVDRSIEDPELFLRTNVLGTMSLLEAARRHGVERFLQVSTDEVYGELGPTGRFTEESCIKPNSPYSASKAAADHLVLSYARTYGLRVNVTRCSNNYGPYQFPEKLIPLFVTNGLEGRELPLYGDGRQVRDWIHVDDHNRAILAVLDRGLPGEVYNIGADGERPNRFIAETIMRELELSPERLRSVTDRPGHDRRYAISAEKLRRDLEWRPLIPLEDGLRQTIKWYRENDSWWGKVKSGEYRTYYERMYGSR